MLPNSRNAALAAVASLLAVSSAAQADTQRVNDRSMAVREVIDRSIPLSPGADVSVHTVGGPVTIETGDGNMAQVHIVRGAATARELACYRVDVTGGGDSLTIKHVQFSKREGCDSIQAGQEVRLRLPRSVDVSLDAVAGPVDVAPIEGELRLSGIAGHVRARGVRSADVSGLAGGLELTVGQLTRDVKVAGIVGQTDITFTSGANADVQVDSIMGNTTSSSPGIPISWNNGRASARVGSGGIPVSVSAVVGHVTLHGG